MLNDNPINYIECKCYLDKLDPLFKMKCFLLSRHNLLLEGCYVAVEISPEYYEPKLAFCVMSMNKDDIEQTIRTGSISSQVESKGRDRFFQFCQTQLDAMLVVDSKNSSLKTFLDQERQIYKAFCNSK